MKKVCLLFCMLAMLGNIYAQSITEKLKTAVVLLEKDPHMRHAIMSLYVADAKTGHAIFEKNIQVGLAPASTQKIITSATALDLLSKEFRFKTYFRHDLEIKNEELTGNIYVTGEGDPTLGSWRWSNTTELVIMNKIIGILKKNKIKRIMGDIWIDDLTYTAQPVPDGWIWQDIGNYYGAGSWSINWRENQYDLVLQSDGQIGNATSMIRTVPELYDFSLTNSIKAAKKGSGDNGYIYASPFAKSGFTTGTIPVDQKAFIISGSISNPPFQFSKTLERNLAASNIFLAGKLKLYSAYSKNGQPVEGAKHEMDSITSPDLDSMNYWFLQKSINLYGEAFVKALAYKYKAQGTTELGIEVIRNFWTQRGIEKSALHIMDGSGLSPQNRVTTHALVSVLLYAKTRSWFPSFYHALPTFNGMKIKSGSIGGARSFAGYHTSATRKEYVFAIIVNNYDGSPGEMVKKMYKVLDVLK